MSFTSDFAAAVKDLPKFTKAVVAFATSAAASEGTIAAIAQYTHIIPPGWTQAIAAGISVIAAFGAILTELESSQTVGQKAKEVLAEISEILEVAKTHGVSIIPATQVQPATPSRQDIATVVSNAVQPVVNDVSAVVSDVASAAASKVVNQVITDFKK